MSLWLRKGAPIIQQECSGFHNLVALGNLAPRICFFSSFFPLLVFVDIKRNSKQIFGSEWLMMNNGWMCVVCLQTCKICHKILVNSWKSILPLLLMRVAVNSIKFTNGINRLAFDGASANSHLASICFGVPILWVFLCSFLHISVGSLNESASSHITWCEQNTSRKSYCLGFGNYFYTLFGPLYDVQEQVNWHESGSVWHAHLWVKCYPSVSHGRSNVVHSFLIVTQVAMRVKCKESTSAVGRRRCQSKRRSHDRCAEDRIGHQQRINGNAIWYSEWHWWHTFKHRCDLNAKNSPKLATMTM